MSTFDDREKGFEAKFAQDALSKFRILAQRNRLVGEWAAGLLGYSGQKARAHVESVVASDLEKPGDDDIIEKLARDFRSAGLTVSVEEIRAQIAACHGRVQTEGDRAAHSSARAVS